MNRLTAALSSATLLLAAALSTTANAAPGHCLYKQFAPKLRVWYPVCEMPAASRADCETIISANRVQVEYGEGECSTRNLTAVCETRGRHVFFYSGRRSDLQRGCEQFLHGVLRDADAPAPGTEPPGHPDKPPPK